MLAGLRWQLIGVDGAEDGDCRGSLQFKLINSLFGSLGSTICRVVTATQPTPPDKTPHHLATNTLGKKNGARGKVGMMASLSA